MTRQESFKRRVRTRMATTGERYGAARRVLLEQAASRISAPLPQPPAADGTRPRAAPPEVADASVLEATGRTWNQWCDLVDDWPERDEGHAAIAAWLADAHGLDGWWSQTVAVGYERITGRRLPHQRPDGTFTAGRSRTVDVEASSLRTRLLDPHARGELLPGLASELRSRPDAKAIRLGIDPGVVLVTITPRADGRTRVVVAHERLTSPGAVEQWQAYWADWLASLDTAADGDD